MTGLIKSYFVQRTDSSSPATSVPVMESSTDHFASTSSTGNTSITSGLEDPHELGARTLPNEPAGFRVSGFTAVNSAPATPAKKRDSESASSARTSTSKSAGRASKQNTMNVSKQKLLADGIQALDIDWSLPENTRKSVVKPEKTTDGASRIGKAARNAVDAVGVTATTLGKRARGALKPLKKQLSGEEKERRKSNRIQELDERVIEDEDVEEEVQHQSKKSRVTKDEVVTTGLRPSRPQGEQLGNKQWESTGVYVGVPGDALQLQNRSKKNANNTYVIGNKSLPGPLFMGQRLYDVGREFSLPYDIYSPLQTRQPKPEEWRKTKTNRFVGDAGAEWKKTKPLPPSFCRCKKSTGCDDKCQNRAMSYECDENNCSLGADYCDNRPFAELKRRREAGRNYDIGVEVYPTPHKGHGVRACRSFEPNQVIVEYAGEIITQEECERRMNDEYKDNECYYLMEFDQNMIIDATRGTMARFVNHSCDPNCEMTKWIVSGKPRMALFAGPNGVMTGEELTYDYNQDNFSTKNVKPCYCGAECCRKFLGPRPPKDKESEVRKNLATGLMAGAKRKVEELFTDNGSSSATTKPERERSVLKKAPPKTKSASSLSASTKPAANQGKRTVSASTGETTLVDAAEFATGNDDFVIRKTATKVPSAPVDDQAEIAKRNSLSTARMLKSVHKSLKRATSVFDRVDTERKSDKSKPQPQPQPQVEASQSRKSLFDFGFASNVNNNNTTSSAARVTPPVDKEIKPKRTPAAQRWFYEPVPLNEQTSLGDPEAILHKTKKPRLSQPASATRPASMSATQASSSSAPLASTTAASPKKRKAGPGRPRKDGQKNKSGFFKKPSLPFTKPTPALPKAAAFPNLGRDPAASGTTTTIASANNAAFTANAAPAGPEVNATAAAAVQPKERRPKKLRHSWFYETVPTDQELDARKVEEKRRSKVVLMDEEELKAMEVQGKRGSLRGKPSIKPVVGEAM
ncbi:MAG: hypothetical protein M1828_006988 [Chrysothrix sp. TS-e1954]|nr:MAG: hypothetical protein M1828_006988 [Chrysothrix sp. TS-e1954]